MKSKRYGSCRFQHSEITLKKVIKDWAKERKYEGIVFSEIEIKKIVQENLETMNNEEACNWLNCEMGAK
jgi:hypothetical protein